MGLRLWIRCGLLNFNVVVLSVHLFDLVDRRRSSLIPYLFSIPLVIIAIQLDSCVAPSSLTPYLFGIPLVIIAIQLDSCVAPIVQGLIVMVLLMGKILTGMVISGPLGYGFVIVIARCDGGKITEWTGGAKLILNRPVISTCRWGGRSARLNETLGENLIINRMNQLTMVTLRISYH